MASMPVYPGDDVSLPTFLLAGLPGMQTQNEEREGEEEGPLDFRTPACGRQERMAQRLEPLCMIREDVLIPGC